MGHLQALASKLDYLAGDDTARFSAAFRCAAPPVLCALLARYSRIMLGPWLPHALAHLLLAFILEPKCPDAATPPRARAAPPPPALPRHPPTHHP